jgi:Cdc6-like AAA superfamily ATPase|tara:strand:- start:368 stop:535 length:168 start_codon:yes stop_codon:yes gene_type:complete
MKKEVKKSKTQLLRDLQDVVDSFNEKKKVVDFMLDEIDILEKKYHQLVSEIKDNK